MFARLFAAAALVSAAMSINAQGFAYAPGSGQYRVTSATNGTQEVMGQTQPFETSNNELLTVALARATGDTMALTVKVDSVDAVGPMGMPVPGVDKLKGATVTARLSPAGVVYSSAGPTDDSLPNGAQVTTELSRLLPRVRATLAPGAKWTDTTSGAVRQNGVEIQRTVVATYTVAGDTTIAGQKAWKLNRETTTTMTGSGSANGQLMTMTGSSNGKGTQFIAQNGVYLGGQTEDQANVKITLTAQAMDVTVNSTSKTKIEKVQ